MLLLVSTIIAIMMKGDAVELLERICDLTTGSCEVRVQRNTFRLARARASNVHAPAIFDIAEVNCVNATALVGNHGRFHVTYQSPLRLAEEWMSLDVRRTSSGTEALCLVLDEQLADQRFAKTVLRVRNARSRSDQVVNLL